MVKVALGNIYGVIVKTIDLEKGESIELEIRRASLEEQLASLVDQNWIEETAKIRSMIVGWRGVFDEDGKPIEYSWDKLNRLCAIYTNAVWSIAFAIREVLTASVDETGDRSKNCEAPPLAGGTETTTETVSLTPSSDTTLSDSASSDYATLSE